MARGPHPFDALIEHAAAILAERLSGVIGRSSGATTSRAPGGLSANDKRRRAMVGRKLDMSCRIAGCKNKSGGPRHGFMCEVHQKLPKKEQQAARDAWKSKRAA